MYRALLSITISAAVAFAANGFGRPTALIPQSDKADASRSVVGPASQPSAAPIPHSAKGSGFTAAPTPHPAKGPGFAVVELFTSEGCSSCPPADELLAAIAKKYPENVYVLSFHVDYWDRLGWKDAYSNAAYTRRQQEYAQQFSLNSIYTPQAVVNGKVQFVGSDENRLRSAIDEGIAAKAPADKITLSARSEGDGNVKVSYNVDNPGKGTLKIALVQSQASSQVLRGENQGRKLEHVNVVRAFQSVTPQQAGAGILSLKLPAGIIAKDCKIVAFLQEQRSGQILDAKQAAIE